MINNDKVAFARKARRVGMGLIPVLGLSAIGVFFGLPELENNNVQAAPEEIPEIITASLPEEVTPTVDLIGASGCQVMVMGDQDVFTTRQTNENVIELDVALGSMTATTVEFDRNAQTLLMSTPKGSEKHKIGINIKNHFQTSLIGDEPMQCQTTMNSETGVYNLTCGIGSQFDNATEIKLLNNNIALIIPTVTATTDQEITQYNCALPMRVPPVGTEQEFAYNWS